MKVRDIIVREEYKVTKSDTQGVELTSNDGVKMTIPADKTASIQSDPSNPSKFKMNPDTVSSDSDKPSGPAVGAEVELPTATEEYEDDLIGSRRNKDVGGDPTDDFIDDVVDKDYEPGSLSYQINRMKHLGSFSR